jgi:peroxidase
MGQHRHDSGKPGRGRRKLFTTLFVTALVSAGTVIAGSAMAQQTPNLPFEVQGLDGSGNNVANPTWGRSGNNYSRVANARYADGVGQPVASPNARLVSNRIFNDVRQNLFSERSVTQWGWTWGQFLDHTFGLRLGRAADDPVGEQANIPFNPNDPVEEFENDLGVIGFERSAIAPGTGVTTPRQQVNTISSYIDAFAVYGGTTQRLEWLRNGSVDGNVGNNQASLLLPNGYLPQATARGNPATAPEMEIGGQLALNPTQATIAGDIRANENILLNATHTLFAREHNRIVAQLPSSLSQEQRFQIARRVVIAEQQYITYNEFLPAMGVILPAYTGYRSNINTDLSNEFATTGYRAHSQIHGEVELETDADRYTAAQLEAFEERGIEVEVDGDEVVIAVSLNTEFFNPDLVPALGLGPLLAAIGGEPQYKNDEQFDNGLRSVLFQIPVEENPECLIDSQVQCFDGVTDLGAIDIARAFDHGIPSYNQLRQAYGLAPRTSFTAITGESTDQFPPGLGVNNPASLAFTELRDLDGNLVDLNDEDAVEGTGVTGVRASTLAARLRGVFGSVNNIDAFTGMISEQHVPGADMGELQRAIWTREFSRLRDGDRFFYGNSAAGLSTIRQQYGIDFRVNLGDVIARNTDIPRDELNGNVFIAADEEATNCAAAFNVVDQYPGGFLATVTVTNTGTTPINGWSTEFRFPTGQAIQDAWNARFTQSGPLVTMSVRSGDWQGNLAPGQSATGWMRASWDNATNARPTHYRLNNGRCTT